MDETKLKNIIENLIDTFLIAGDLSIKLRNQGLIKEDHVHAEIGELNNGTKTGRTSYEQITLFKSCGVAVQDAVSASIVIKNSESQNLGILAHI